MYTDSQVRNLSNIKQRLRATLPLGMVLVEKITEKSSMSILE